MPKLLVLFDGASDDVAGMAESIRDGARSVRFAEADLRRLGSEAASPRVERVPDFEGLESLQSYDAVCLGSQPGGHERLARLLADASRLGMTGALANKLGAVFPAADPAATGDAHPLWQLLAPMARYGMILVPPGYAGPAGQPEEPGAAAQRLGKRLVDIAGWITHARSHHHH